MTDLYLEWAGEIIDTILDTSWNPYTATHRDDLAKEVAKKLKADLEGCIVPEWFCSDCDYYRRCEQ